MSEAYAQNVHTVLSCQNKKRSYFNILCGFHKLHPCKDYLQAGEVGVVSSRGFAKISGQKKTGKKNTRYRKRGGQFMWLWKNQLTKQDQLTRWVCEEGWSVYVDLKKPADKTRPVDKMGV